MSISTRSGVRTTPGRARSGPSWASVTRGRGAEQQRRASARRRRCRRRRARGALPLPAVTGRAAVGAGRLASIARGSRTTISLPRPGPSLKRAHRAAVHLDQAAHHGETDAQAALRAVESARLLHEEIEGPIEQERRHPDAVVAHAHHRFAALDGRLRARRAPGVRVLRRVVEEVREHLDQAGRIRVDEDRARRARSLDRRLLFFASSGRLTSIARRRISRAVDRLLAQLDLPWLTRETSSRSSSRRFMCSTCRAMTVRQFAGSSVARFPAGAEPRRR